MPTTPATIEEIKITPMNIIGLSEEQCIELAVQDSVKNSKRQLIRAAMALLANDGNGDLGKMPANWDDKECARLIEMSYKDRLVQAVIFLTREHNRLTQEGR